MTKVLGKTIRIYLVDGTPTGLRTAEIMNWTGKVLVAARTDLPDLARRDEAKRTGVYCLVGPDPKVPGRLRVYVGEADSVMVRLKSHDVDGKKDFWTQVVLVISKDENLTKSHGRYLESRLVSMAHDAGRAELDNGTAPPLPALPEPDVADMEGFLDHVRMVFPVLGFDFLQPKLTAADADQSSSPLFEVAQVGAKATARLVGDEFVVLKGSTARRKGAASWDAYVAMRDQLVSEGKLVKTENPDLYEFGEDVAFSSPSAAVAAVLARNGNGRTEWRIVGTKTTYAQWMRDKLEKSVPDTAGG
jgi:hypothetical protein